MNRRGSHIAEESRDGLHESMQGLEQMMKGHTTTQMFPEVLDGIEIGRVGWQPDQFNFILMLGQKGLDRFDEVDATGTLLTAEK